MAQDLKSDATGFAPADTSKVNTCYVHAQTTVSLALNSHVLQDAGLSKRVSAFLNIFIFNFINLYENG